MILWNQRISRKFLAVLFVVLVANLGVYGQVRLMTLGDSITVGAVAKSNGEISGYRLQLYNDLTQRGDNIQMVGANNPNISNYDGYSPTLYNIGQNYNSGFSGYTSGDILANLAGNQQSSHTSYSNLGGYWMTGGNGTGRSAINPDIVLLMIGTNDVRDGIPLSTLQSNVTGILNWFETNRPDSIVFVSTILPTTTGGTGTAFSSSISTAQNYNSWLANTLLPEYSDYHLMDIYSLFVNSTNTAANAGYIGSDGVHPTTLGYDTMADAWANEIQSYVNEVPEPHGLQLLLFGGIALIVICSRRIRSR